VATVFSIFDVTPEPHQHSPDGLHVFPPQMGKTEHNDAFCIPRLDHDRANVKHDVGGYLLWKEQVVRPRFPAPFYKSLMSLGCSTHPAS
jgi:hypothetical protein